ncbi:hypothetical protein L195_g064613, partial [Trifolium pratense]
RGGLEAGILIRPLLRGRSMFELEVEEGGFFLLSILCGEVLMR